MNNQLKRAFTSLELLLTLSIVGLLAAILFPVFARARENARRSSCQSNLKQIGLGLKQYQQDYDERTLVVDENSRYLWFQSLRPYVKSEQVFRCPAVAESSDTPTSQPTSDYAFNGFFTHALSVDNIQNAAEQIALSERVKRYDAADYHTWEAVPFGLQLNTALHLAGANYLFADSHVKWYRWPNTLQPAVLDPTSGTLSGMHNRDALPKPLIGLN